MITAAQFRKAVEILDRHMTSPTAEIGVSPDWWLSERSARRDSDHGTGQPNAVLMEGAYGWTDITFADWGEAFRADLRALGLYAEAYSGWAIHFYEI